MTPRPRTIDDPAILEAAHRVISRLGPARFTLSDIGREAGLSAATLLQRFGSKRGLLLALVDMAVESVDACFAAVRSANPSPLAALMAAGIEMAKYVDKPEEMANHLAFLQMDLSDPEFHSRTLENARRIRAGYRMLLDEAVAAREIVRCDTEQLARAVDAVSGGSLISWAIYREGTAAAWVRGDLATLIDPYRTNTRLRAIRRRPRVTRAPRATATAVAAKRRGR